MVTQLEPQLSILIFYLPRTGDLLVTNLLSGPVSLCRRDLKSTCYLRKDNTTLTLNPPMTMTSLIMELSMLLNLFNVLERFRVDF